MSAVAVAGMTFMIHTFCIVSLKDRVFRFRSYFLFASCSSGSRDGSLVPKASFVGNRRPKYGCCLQSLVSLQLTAPNVIDLTPFWNTQATYWLSPNISNTGQEFNYEYERVNQIALQQGDEPGADEPGEIKEWSVRVFCKQFELDGSFSVYFFLGGVPNDSNKWLQDPAFAGTFDVFANPTPDECANCTEQKDLLIKGYVHINKAIVKRTKGSLDAEVVVPYLKRELNWAIKKVWNNLLPMFLPYSALHWNFRQMAPLRKSRPCRRLR